MQPMGNLKTVRPPRPMFQMSVPSSQIEGHNGQDPDYDRALFRYFDPYHRYIIIIKCVYHVCLQLTDLKTVLPEKKQKPIFSCQK